MISPWGALVNALAIAAGGLVGVVLGGRMPERLKALIFQGLGMCVLIIGVQAALSTTRLMLTTGAIVLGCALGEFLQLEDRLTQLTENIKKRTRSNNPRFTEGLLNGTIIFCVGAMGIMASFEEGLRGVRDIAYAKAVIDTFVALVMASAMGAGVIFSGICVFIYQGILVIAASTLSHVLTQPIITEITATGGIIVMGIGINMLGLLHIRLTNMVPALLFAVILAVMFV